jgi:hypothetical protein
MLLPVWSPANQFRRVWCASRTWALELGLVFGVDLEGDVAER